MLSPCLRGYSLETSFGNPKKGKKFRLIYYFKLSVGVNVSVVVVCPDMSAS